ncbi:hypothetical protein [Paenibacillus terrae]|nr:hypothetical protein [Paenibacillus terrae]
MSRPFISLCMIVKNEAERIEACLQSARDVVDEITTALERRCRQAVY